MESTSKIDSLQLPIISTPRKHVNTHTNNTNNAQPLPPQDRQGLVDYVLANKSSSSSPSHVHTQRKEGQASPQSPRAPATPRGTLFTASLRRPYRGPSSRHEAALREVSALSAPNNLALRSPDAATPPPPPPALEGEQGTLSLHTCSLGGVASRDVSPPSKNVVLNKSEISGGKRGKQSAAGWSDPFSTVGVHGSLTRWPSPRTVDSSELLRGEVEVPSLPMSVLSGGEGAANEGEGRKGLNDTNAPDLVRRLEDVIRKHKVALVAATATATTATASTTSASVSTSGINGAGTSAPPQTVHVSKSIRYDEPSRCAGMGADVLPHRGELIPYHQDRVVAIKNGSDEMKQAGEGSNGDKENTKALSTGSSCRSYDTSLHTRLFDGHLGLCRNICHVLSAHFKAYKNVFNAVVSSGDAMRALYANLVEALMKMELRVEAIHKEHAHHVAGLEETIQGLRGEVLRLSDTEKALGTIGTLEEEKASLSIRYEEAEKRTRKLKVTLSELHDRYSLLQHRHVLVVGSDEKARSQLEQHQATIKGLEGQVSLGAFEKSELQRTVERLGGELAETKKRADRLDHQLKVFEEKCARASEEINLLKYERSRLCRSGVANYGSLSIANSSTTTSTGGGGGGAGAALRGGGRPDRVASLSFPGGPLGGVSPSGAVPILSFGLDGTSPRGSEGAAAAARGELMLMSDRSPHDRPAYHLSHAHSEERALSGGAERERASTPRPEWSYFESLISEGRRLLGHQTSSSNALTLDASPSEADKDKRSGEMVATADEARLYGDAKGLLALTAFARGANSSVGDHDRDTALYERFIGRGSKSDIDGDGTIRNRAHLNRPLLDGAHQIGAFTSYDKAARMLSHVGAIHKYVKDMRGTIRCLVARIVDLERFHATLGPSLASSGSDCAEASSSATVFTYSLEEEKKAMRARLKSLEAELAVALQHNQTLRLSYANENRTALHSSNSSRASSGYGRHFGSASYNEHSSVDNAQTKGTANSPPHPLLLRKSTTIPRNNTNHNTNDNRGGGRSTPPTAKPLLRLRSVVGLAAGGSGGRKRGEHHGTKSRSRRSSMSVVIVDDVDDSRAFGPFSPRRLDASEAQEPNDAASSLLLGEVVLSRAPSFSDPPNPSPATATTSGNSADAIRRNNATHSDDNSTEQYDVHVGGSPSVGEAIGRQARAPQQRKKSPLSLNAANGQPKGTAGGDKIASSSSSPLRKRSNSAAQGSFYNRSPTAPFPMPRATDAPSSSATLISHMLWSPKGQGHYCYHQHLQHNENGRAYLAYSSSLSSLEAAPAVLLVANKIAPLIANARETLATTSTRPLANSLTEALFRQWKKGAAESPLVFVSGGGDGTHNGPTRRTPLELSKATVHALLDHVLKPSCGGSEGSISVSTGSLQEDSSGGGGGRGVHRGEGGGKATEILVEARHDSILLSLQKALMRRRLLSSGALRIIEMDEATGSKDGGKQGTVDEKKAEPRKEEGPTTKTVIDDAIEEGDTTSFPLYKEATGHDYSHATDSLKGASEAIAKDMGISTAPLTNNTTTTATSKDDNDGTRRSNTTKRGAKKSTTNVTQGAKGKSSSPQTVTTAEKIESSSNSNNGKNSPNSVGKADTQGNVNEQEDEPKSAVATDGSTGAEKGCVPSPQHKEVGMIDSYYNSPEFEKFRIAISSPQWAGLSHHGAGSSHALLIASMAYAPVLEYSALHLPVSVLVELYECVYDYVSLCVPLCTNGKGVIAHFRPSDPPSSFVCPTGAGVAVGPPSSGPTSSGPKPKLPSSTTTTDANPAIQAINSSVPYWEIEAYSKSVAAVRSAGSDPSLTPAARFAYDTSFMEDFVSCADTVLLNRFAAVVELGRAHDETCNDLRNRVLSRQINTELSPTSPKGGGALSRNRGGSSRLVPTTGTSRATSPLAGQGLSTPNTRGMDQHQALANSTAIGQGKNILFFSDSPSSTSRLRHDDTNKKEQRPKPLSSEAVRRDTPTDCGDSTAQGEGSLCVESVLYSILFHSIRLQHRLPAARMFLAHLSGAVPKFFFTMLRKQLHRASAVAMDQTSGSMVVEATLPLPSGMPSTAADSPHSLVTSRSYRSALGNNNNNGGGAAGAGSATASASYASKRSNGRASGLTTTPTLTDFIAVLGAEWPMYTDTQLAALHEALIVDGGMAALMFEGAGPQHFLGGGAPLSTRVSETLIPQPPTVESLLIAPVPKGASHSHSSSSIAAGGGRLATHHSSGRVEVPMGNPQHTSIASLSNASISSPPSSPLSLIDPYYQALNGMARHSQALQYGLLGSAGSGGGLRCALSTLLKSDRQRLMLLHDQLRGHNTNRGGGEGGGVHHHKHIQRSDQIERTSSSGLRAPSRQPQSTPSASTMDAHSQFVSSSSSSSSFCWLLSLRDNLSKPTSAFKQALIAIALHHHLWSTCAFQSALRDIVTMAGGGGGVGGADRTQQQQQRDVGGKGPSYLLCPLSFYEKNETVSVLNIQQAFEKCDPIGAGAGASRGGGLLIPSMSIGAGGLGVGMGASDAMRRFVSEVCCGDPNADLHPRLKVYSRDVARRIPLVLYNRLSPIMPAAYELQGGGGKQKGGDGGVGEEELMERSPLLDALNTTASSSASSSSAAYYSKSTSKAREHDAANSNTYPVGRFATHTRALKHYATDASALYVDAMAAVGGLGGENNSDNRLFVGADDELQLRYLGSLAGVQIGRNK